MNSNYLKRMADQRAAAWKQAVALLDHAANEKRDLTAAEESAFAALNSDLDAGASRIKDLEESETRQREANETMDRLLARPADRGSATGTGSVDHDVDEAFRNAILRRDPTPIDVGFDGARSGYQPGIERRALVTTSGGGLVATSFWDSLQRHLVESAAVLAAGATLINTESGEPLRIPKSTANSVAARVAEGATIPASDPTLGTATLNAYKYAFIVQISSELAEDTSFDVAAYLAEQAGTAMGNGAGAEFVTGTGTAQPLGAVTGATVGITGSTGVVGAFNSDNLIDLYHSIPEPYARSASAAWLMRNTTLGAVRKLKDSQGRYLFDINAPAGSGASGTLLGRPVYVDPTVPAIGLGAKSVLFGDFSKYWVRSVKGLRFERSDEFAFDKDMVTFRAKWRADGTVVDQTGALKVFAGASA